MFIPPKLLAISITAISNYANFSDSADTTDPWSGYPYQWTVAFNVTTQPHSSPYTATPFFYNGNDVAVGMWLADIISGYTVKIVSITSQNPGTVVAVCEDVERYNTFTDPTGQGQGIGNTGNGFVFDLGDDGLPILTPMSSVQTQLSQNLAWQLDQVSRFRYRNLMHSFYRVNQSGHSFAIGDVIQLTSAATYSKINPATNSVLSTVGTVSSIGIPSASWFTFRAAGKVVTSISPSLPGNPGDLIYVTAAGAYTNVAPSVWVRPIYIRLEVGTSGILLDRNSDTAGSLGYASQTFVVADETAASAITAANVGDQLLIENSGYGEWSHQVKHADGTWRLLVSQDASHVDAETLDAALTFASPSAVALGNISAGRLVTFVSVTVSAAFGPGATLSVGATGDASHLMAMSEIDLTATGTYTATPSISFTDPYTAINAYFSNDGTQAGSMTVSVTYT